LLIIISIVIIKIGYTTYHRQVCKLVAYCWRIMISMLQFWFIEISNWFSILSYPAEPTLTFLELRIDVLKILCRFFNSPQHWIWIIALVSIRYRGTSQAWSILFVLLMSITCLIFDESLIISNSCIRIDNLFFKKKWLIFQL